MLKFDIPDTLGQYPNWKEMDDDVGNNISNTIKLENNVKHFSWLYVPKADNWHQTCIFTKRFILK